MSYHRNRVLWLCRRGMREMDVLLEEFVQRHYDSMDSGQKQELESFLQHSDLDIMDWVANRSKPPARWRNIINMLQQQGKNAS